MNKIIRIIHTIEDSLIAFILIAMIVIATTQIISRNFFDVSFSWGDPLLRVLVLWVGLLGALIASRSNQNKHISIDILSRIFSERGRLISQVVANLFTTIVVFVIAYHSARFVFFDYEAGTMAFANVPAWITELILPAAFGLIGLRYFLLSLIQCKTLFLNIKLSGTKS